jgi:hypothetical protein
MKGKACQRTRDYTKRGKSNSGKRLRGKKKRKRSWRTIQPFQEWISPIMTLTELTIEVKK